MIHAYNELYLNTVMHNLGELFDIAINSLSFDSDEFAMKFAKKYAIIVNVNKNWQFSSKNHSDLYNVHKNTVLIL